MLKSFVSTILFLMSATYVAAQTPAADQNGSMALSPARFEVEMQPGTERTVIVNLDYRGTTSSSQPARIVASLNDWSLTKDGLVNYYPASTQEGSACPWMIYSPGEGLVTPGTMHQIRVTISVPLNADPGDHLAALVIEQRPDVAKYQSSSTRQMVIRYRLATVFYIKVGKLTRHGDLYDLLAEQTQNGVVVTPRIRNVGNTALRPLAALTVLDSAGKPVVQVPEAEVLPVLAGSEAARSVVIDKALPVGRYTVKYRVDFQNGQPAIEGVTEISVRTQVAEANSPTKKP